MNKLSLALVAAGLTASLGAFAAVPTDAQPFHFVVPNLQSGIEITLEGLLMRPDLANTNFLATPDAALSFTGNTGQGGVARLNSATTLQNQDPEMNMWGFRVGLGYIFPNSGNDVQLAWTHLFNTTNTTNLALPPYAFGVPSLFELAVGAVDDTSSTETRYDAIDLDVGQYIDVGTRLRMRLFGGLRAAEVRNDVTNNYAVPVAVNFQGTEVGINGYAQRELDSKFTGIGPRFGVDSSYHISDCFGIVGHFAASLLVGEADSNTTTNGSLPVVVFDDGEPEFTQVVNLNSTVDEANNPVRVVPAFDGKLGLDYTYIFQDQSTFSVEAGYQWTDYVNALDTINNALSVKTNSIGFDGPYVTLNYKM